jgi:hypothetical protein
VQRWRLQLPWLEIWSLTDDNLHDAFVCCECLDGWATTGKPSYGNWALCLFQTDGEISTFIASKAGCHCVLETWTLPQILSVLQGIDLQWILLWKSSLSSVKYLKWGPGSEFTSIKMMTKVHCSPYIMWTDYCCGWWQTTNKYVRPREDWPPHCPHWREYKLKPAPIFVLVD